MQACQRFRISFGARARPVCKHFEAPKIVRADLEALTSAGLRKYQIGHLSSYRGRPAQGPLSACQSVILSWCPAPRKSSKIAPTAPGSRPFCEPNTHGCDPLRVLGHVALSGRGRAARGFVILSSCHSVILRRGKKKTAVRSQDGPMTG